MCPFHPQPWGRLVMKAGWLELSPSPATASEAGRGTGPSVTFGSLYLRRTKVGLFLADQRVMSVSCKDPSVKCLGLYHPCCSYSGPGRPGASAGALVPFSPLAGDVPPGHRGGGGIPDDVSPQAGAEWIRV